MGKPEPSVFGEEYASLYDVVYAEKDYDLECEVIQSAIDDHRSVSGHKSRILDLGCGSGEHALRLARRGHQVTGVDLSDSMLDLAREKAAQEDLSVDFHLADISALDFEAEFDVAVMMFAVLGYQTTNEALLSTLRGIRQALVPGGLLIFDAWYGPAVLGIRPQPRRRVIRQGEREITRESLATIDAVKQTCRVDIRMTTADGFVVADESHEMRFFFAKELELLLEVCGFEMEALGRFPEPAEALTEHDWNLLCISATKR